MRWASERDLLVWLDNVIHYLYARTGVAIAVILIWLMRAYLKL